MGGPWWLVCLALVLAIYWGWRAYLHHRWPVRDDFEER